MQDKKLNDNCCNKKTCKFCIGQMVLYKGMKGKILQVEPILKVKLLKNDEIVSGNIFEDVKPI
jgi:hypothetical protein